MVLCYWLERVGAAGRHFNAFGTVHPDREVAAEAPPQRRICRECDLRALCRTEARDRETG